MSTSLLVEKVSVEKTSRCPQNAINAAKEHSLFTEQLGACSIKLYRSINYGFVVTAKF